MNNAFMIANSADPDVRPHSLAFHLGLTILLTHLLLGQTLIRRTSPFPVFRGVGWYFSLLFKF